MLQRQAPLKILHVIDNLALGGTQRLMLDLLGELHRRGFSQRLVVMSHASRTYAGYQPAVDPEYLNQEDDYRRPAAVWRCSKALRRHIKRWSPDIVHSYLWLSNFIGVLATRGTRARHLWHIVDRRSWQASRRLRHRLRRLALRLLLVGSRTRFMAVSESARQYACEHMRWKPEHIRVAYNSIDASRFVADRAQRAGLQNHTPVIGVAGRLVEEKGHRYLFEAAAILRNSGHVSRLLITGNGPDRETLGELASQLNIESSVEFLGEVPDMPSFYRRLDLFVVPSIHSEGLPTTILEAMASGIPVVVTDVGGATEAVRDDEEGLVVPPRNPSALAAAIQALLESPDRANRLAEQARRRVAEMFSLEAMTDAVLRAYDDLMKGW